MARESPLSERPKAYNERADMMARRIAALTAGSPAAVLSGDALALLQEDEDLTPFWWQDSHNPYGVPLRMEPSELKNLGTAELPPMQASLNLHVGNEMLVIEKDKEPQLISSSSFSSQVLPPMALAIVKSREFICMPPFLVALLVSPVRTAINGISNISTMIDPNFEGFLLLNFSNLSPWNLQIAPGDLVCRAVFHMVTQVGLLREFTQYSPKYQPTHGPHLLLKDIINLRTSDMQRTVHSPILQEKLQKWIAAQKTE